SDITYRLFDYGRPRKLHLDAALEVLNPGPHNPALRRKAAACPLVDGPHFSLELVEGPGHVAGGVQVIPIDGEVAAAGVKAEPGQCLFVSAPAALEGAPGSSYLIARSLEG